MITSNDAYIVEVIPLWLRLVKSLAIVTPTILYAGIFVEIGIWPVAIVLLVLLIPAWRIFKKTESKTLATIHNPISKKDKYIALGIVLILGLLFLIANINNKENFIITAMLITASCFFIFVSKGEYTLTFAAKEAKADEERIAAEKLELDGEKWWWKLLGYILYPFFLGGVILIILFYVSSLLTILNTAQKGFMVTSAVVISKHEFLSEMCQKKSTCKKYAEVNFACAVAGNFDQCMKIRMGEKQNYSYCAEDGTVIGLTNEITPSTIQCVGNTLGYFNYIFDKKKRMK